MAQMYKKILVPIDGSPTSLRGLDEAIKLAKSMGSTLKLVHVVNELIIDSGYAPGGGMYYSDIIDSLREGGKKTLAAAEDVVRGQGVKFESQLLETIGRRASDVIVEQATEWDAELIVMGTHGRRGIRRLALGSDAEMVLRHAPVAVLMVRDTSD
jgi:nucleotide-binding universal stress UspA family protein